MESEKIAKILSQLTEREMCEYMKASILYGAVNKYCDGKENELVTLTKIKKVLSLNKLKDVMEYSN
jgi:hypothetical protein